MIETRKDLEYCLAEDCKKYGKLNLFFKWLSQNDNYHLILFM